MQQVNFHPDKALQHYEEQSHLLLEFHLPKTHLTTDGIPKAPYLDHTACSP